MYKVSCRATPFPRQAVSSFEVLRGSSAIRRDQLAIEPVVCWTRLKIKRPGRVQARAGLFAKRAACCITTLVSADTSGNKVLRPPHNVNVSESRHKFLTMLRMKISIYICSTDEAVAQVVSADPENSLHSASNGSNHAISEHCLCRRMMGRSNESQQRLREQRRTTALWC